MNLSLFTSRALGKSELYLKKNAPTILTGVGVAGFAVTTVLVGRAVLKSQPVIGDLKYETELLVETYDKDDELTEKDKTKKVGELWVRRAPTLIKIYAPAITVGSVSIFCVLAAHGMMRKNQAALLAAYATLDTGFRAYRKRIEEELGEEQELAIYRGHTRTALVDDENIEVGCIIEEYRDDIPSPYSRFFDESSLSWSKTPEYNLTFLRVQQQWANDRLQGHGYLFLNEVYEALGLPRSQAGQIVGWKLDSNEDGFVDFGLYAIGDESNRAFINGLEPTVLLDFNVDGPITI